jgi:hypothetical protein
MLIETLLMTGENFATFIRITELNITAVPKMITLVVVVAWPYLHVCFLCRIWTAFDPINHCYF